MCGIIAGISPKVVDILLLGLKQLQNRGYDSAGITTIVDDNFQTTKYASGEKSSLELLDQEKEKHQASSIGIAHTRWATHGPKTDINSHPHTSYLGNFVLVHNGIIENYLELKKKLIKNDILCVSETDTEVIVNTIELNYLIEQDVEKAIEKTLSQLEGTWGLAIISKFDLDTLYCTRKGSPLLVSVNNNIGLIASEQSAFCNKTNNYIVLNNHDICKLKMVNGQVEMTTREIYAELQIKNKNLELTPFPYKHWTEKEIYEQVDSSLRSISLGGRLLSNNKVKLGGLEEQKMALLEVENLILLGCGTSYFAGMCGKKYFKDLCKFNSVQVIDGAEFELNDIPKNGKTALVLMSQSGETKDLHRCLELCKDLDLITIGVVNVVDSLIAREVDCGCYLNAGREVGVASTKSFTSQVIILSMMAIWFAQVHNINLQKRKKHIRDLRKLYLDIEKTLEKNDIDSFLDIFKTQNNCFILGKDKAEAIAQEAALKIKEISYIHAEGYSSSSLKHGPFALLEKDFPVILVAPENKYFAKNMNAYEEIKSRYAKIILITDKQDLDLPNTILVEKNECYGDLLCIVPLQLLALKLSLYKKCNADMPRNLAKVVTVE
jgi:glucosamine--fructose-6-phosphate aminotransferase (isomerizing)